MVLTSNRRRTASVTALFAAIILILTTLFVISPASAEEGDDPCDQYGYNKFNTASGSQELEWGSMKWGDDAGDLDGNPDTTELSYEIDPGFAVEFCIKAGNIDNTFSGPVFGSGFISHPNPDISHVGWRLVPVATPEEPTFVDADCDDPDASAVNLPETEGVDYTTTGTVAPGETVTVTATPQDGYVFEPGVTTSWEHTFATVPDNCGDIEAVTAEPEFTDPTCEANAIGLVLPDTEGVTYTVTGDEEPGGTVVVTATADEGYFLADDAVTSWEHTFGALATDCGTDTDDEPEPSVTPTTPDEVEVLPNVIEKPAPTPAPAPAPAAQPAAQVAADELPATGLGSTELLLLALLLMGLGASALLAPDRGREY